MIMMTRRRLRPGARRRAGAGGRRQARADRAATSLGTYRAAAAAAARRGRPRFTGTRARPGRRRRRRWRGRRREANLEQEMARAEAAALGAFCLRYPLPRPCIDTATLSKCKNSSEVLRELGEAEVAAQGSDTFTLEAPPATGRWRRRRRDLRPLRRPPQAAAAIFPHNVGRKTCLGRKGE